MLIAQELVGPSKRLKELIQIEHNIVKNSNRPGGDKPVDYLQLWPRIWTKHYQ